jgi:hypothetical protein
LVVLETGTFGEEEVGKSLKLEIYCFAGENRTKVYTYLDLQFQNVGFKSNDLKTFNFFLKKMLFLEYFSI